MDLSATTPLARPRPLLPLTIAFVAGIVLSESVGGVPATTATAMYYGVICACLMAALLTLRGGESRTPIRLLALTFAIALGFARHQACTAIPPNHIASLLADERVLTCIAGRVATQPMTSPAELRNPYLPFNPTPRTRFVLAAREVRSEGAPASVCGSIRVVVKADRVDAQLGDDVVVTGWLSSVRGRRNPGETDWAQIYRLQNIHAVLSVENPELIQREDAPTGAVARVTSWLRGRARSLLFDPFDAGDSEQPRRLLDALVLGHRSAAGRVLNEAFLRTGAVHFLTVSGFHVGVLGGAVWVLMRRILRRGSRSAAIASMAIMLVYAVIVEPNAPVMRATTMGVLLCAAQLARRPLCGMNWLALAALSVLTFNPLELFRAGFQLSFVQVIAIFTIVPWLYRLLVRRKNVGDVPTDAESWPALAARTLWRWLAGLAIVCATAWVVALPLVLHHFGRFAPWGALQSIIVSPLVMLVVVLGFATLAVSWVVPAAGAALGVLLHRSTDALLWVVAHLGSWPNTLIERARPPAWLVIVIYALILALSWFLRAPPRTRPRNWSEPEPAEQSSPRRRRLAATIVAPVLVGAYLWIAWSWPTTPAAGRDCLIYVLSVGSGGAVLVTTGDGDALLVDAGTTYNFDAGETVATATRALGVRRLNRIAVSHANSDHYSGVPTAARELGCDELLLSKYFESAAENDACVARLLKSLPKGMPRRTLIAGHELSVGGAAVEVLWPQEGIEALVTNDRSLVLRVSFGGRKVLIPGDIEQEALRGLVEQHELGEIDLRSDVLIAPHHGSVLPRDTAAFYKTVSPRAVINSTGDERPKLAQMLTEVGGANAIRLLSTHAVGAIAICMTPEGDLRIDTPYASGR